MRGLLALVLLLLVSGAASAGWPLKLGGIASSSPPPTQSIASINLSNTGFTGGSPSGTVVGNVTVTMSPSSPASTASLALGGTDAGSFQLAGSGCSNVSSGTCDLETNGTVATGSYSITLTATQAGATNSPYTPSPFAITGIASGSFTGPCDLVTCAEGYSVDYALSRNYTGALFQLAATGGSHNGQVLDIGCEGASVSGTCAGSTTKKVDLTTWSAFCDGNTGNCAYYKLYAQIQGHANDLLTVGNLSQGITYLTLDGTTGLPILDDSHNCCGGGRSKFDVGGTDSALTGVPVGGVGGGNNPVTVFYLAKPFTETICCGSFGLTGPYSGGPYQLGDDFSLALIYDEVPPVSGGGSCKTHTSFCLDVDNPGYPPYSILCAGASATTDGTGSQYATTLFPVVLAAATYDPNASTITGYVNNAQSWVGACDPAQVHQRNYLHFGAGGDGSPAPYFAYEMYLTNTTTTSGQYQAIFTNTKARYPAFTFQDITP